MRLKIKNKLGKNKEKIQTMYRKADNSKEVRTEIGELDKKEIQKAFFLGEIEKIEKMINRKLDMWKY